MATYIRRLSSSSKSEVEFVIQTGTEIIPVEVKAEGNIAGRCHIRIHLNAQRLEKAGDDDAA
ncbi:MAG: hypothetical protein HUJ76_07315, partial [Parasporobacterium sp.]|nr:hypothetical protein [Parasporobacterium sp.]